MNDRGQMKIENQQLVPLFHPLGGVGEDGFPSSFIHSVALSPSLSLSCLLVLLRLRLGCGEALRRSNGSDGGALAWCSRAYFSQYTSFRSHLSLFQVAVHRSSSLASPGNVFLQLPFFSFFYLSLPSSSPLLHMRAIRAGVCLCFFSPLNIIFCIPRKGGKKKLSGFSLNHGHFASNFYNGPCRRGSLCLAVSCILRLFVISFEEQGINYFKLVIIENWMCVLAFLLY